MDVAVEDVVADVGGRSLHTLDEYFSFGHVKVVVEELTRVFGLPEEIFGNVTPELCRTRERERSGDQERKLSKAANHTASVIFIKRYNF